MKKLLATDKGSNCSVPKLVLHLKLDKQFYLELYHGTANIHSEMAAILTPKRSRDYDSPANEIPDAEPGPQKAQSRRGQQIHPESSHYTGDQTSQMLTVAPSSGRTRKELCVSLRLAVQTKTTHQIRPRIPDHTGPDESPNPYGAACPCDQTAGK